MLHCATRGHHLQRQIRSISYRHFARTLQCRRRAIAGPRGHTHTVNAAGTVVAGQRAVAEVRLTGGPAQRVNVHEGPRRLGVGRVGRRRGAGHAPDVLVVVAQQAQRAAEVRSSRDVAAVYGRGSEQRLATKSLNVYRLF